MNSLELLGARTYVLHLEELKTNLFYTLNLNYGFNCIMNSIELCGAKFYVLKLEEFETNEPCNFNGLSSCEVKTQYV